MAEVHYSTLAAADISENAEYIARDKPDAAYRWVEKQVWELPDRRPHVLRRSGPARRHSYSLLSLCIARS